MATQVTEVVTFTNMIGALGNMEKGVVYMTTAEANYFKNSSQKKFGSGSFAFQQSAAATSLSYTLRDSTGVKSYTLYPNHKYYFGMHVMWRTSGTMQARAVLGKYNYTSATSATLGAWIPYYGVLQVAE